MVLALAIISLIEDSRCHLTPCASAAGACGAAARPKAEPTRAAAPRTRPGQQQARVRQCPWRERPPYMELTCLEEASTPPRIAPPATSMGFARSDRNDMLRTAHSLPRTAPSAQ